MTSTLEFLILAKDQASETFKNIGDSVDKNASKFDKFQGADGLEHKLDDRKLAQDGMRLAFIDGELAGFGVMAA